jgi:hypothetical protein
MRINASVMNAYERIINPQWPVAIDPEPDKLQGADADLTAQRTLRRRRASWPWWVAS